MIPNTPLESLEHWEDDLKKRYPKPHQKQKKTIEIMLTLQEINW